MTASFSSWRGQPSKGRLPWRRSASITCSRTCLAAQGDTKLIVVGLKSADYDEKTLDKLASGAVVTASDPAGLDASFSALADRIAAGLQGVYLLGYCSPKRAGQHTVSISVAGATSTGSAGYSFDADGFTEGCSISTFQQACTGKDCGGLVCGACDDRKDQCDQGSDKCLDFCTVLKACEAITNPQGYAQTCPGCATGFVCDQASHECVCASGTRLCDDGQCHQCCKDGDCSTGQTCQSGQCICTPHDHQACANGNIYWYDSCGSMAEIEQTCTCGCTGTTCSCCPSCSSCRTSAITDGCAGTCAANCTGVCSEGTCCTTNVPSGFPINFDDSGLDGFTTWTLNGVQTVKWQISDHRAASGGYSLYYGNLATLTYDTPGTRNYGVATSPAVTLDVPAGVSNLYAFLSFKVLLSTEFNNVLAAQYDNPAGRDLFKVFVVQNLGKTNETQTGVWSSDNVHGTTIDPANAAAGPQFVSVGIDLSDYKTKKIWLRFSFDTGDGIANGYEGFYVDDLAVQTSTCPLGSP